MGDDHGDLTDIVRASGGGAGTASTSELAGADWKFPSGSINYQTSTFDDLLEGFGNPFNNMRDPLLHELDLAGGVASNPPKSTGIAKVSMGEGEKIGGGNFLPQKVLGEDILIKRPVNIFSRMLQISPNSSKLCTTLPAALVALPTGIKSSPSAATDVMKVNNSVESESMQIPAPRNHGVKRRKSLAKKVVCIPAPAASGSRPGGEVVPSDLWAWRKYGQKPIKGSPYPRGYYRCSSSKGCSARKQVERSRTDPNMLVITYTSEHNHPWPTQRNALAGSTRSQPLKSNSAYKNTPSTNSTAKPTTDHHLKEEHKENQNENPQEAVKDEVVKEEVLLNHDSTEKDDLEMGDQDFDQAFQYESYVPLPALPDSNQSHDDFFADLGELDPDSFDLIFSQGFAKENSHHEEGKGTEKEDNKANMDPFRQYDWPAGTGGS